MYVQNFHYFFFCIKSVEMRHTHTDVVEHSYEFHVLVALSHLLTRYAIYTRNIHGDYECLCMCVCLFQCIFCILLFLKISKSTFL